MLLALAFQERDVDAFLDSLTHEQYEEWIALFYLHPQGWRATNMSMTRALFTYAQSRSKKRLDESDFAIEIAIPMTDTPRTNAARTEAMAIRGEILNRLGDG